MAGFTGALRQVLPELDLEFLPGGFARALERTIRIGLLGLPAG